MSFLQVDVAIQVKRVHVPARDNVIVNRLNKTKVEKEVDHEEVRQERLREAGRLKKLEAIESVSSTFLDLNIPPGSITLLML